MTRLMPPSDLRTDGGTSMREGKSPCICLGNKNECSLQMTVGSRDGAGELTVSGRLAVLD